VWELRSEKQVLTILQKALDASWIRNQVISNNIANVDTPNYKAYKVEFEDLLRDALKKTSTRANITNPRHIPIGNGSLEGVKPRIVRETGTSVRKDGNNVDIDVQQANLASNTIMYQALVDQLSAKLARLKMVINEGRR
jgi:flagellar basal-body rod protein FlgB